MKHEVIEIDDGLRLVALAEDRAGELFDLTDANRDYLGKWLPWVEMTRSEEDSRMFILETQEERWQEKGYGFGIEHKGRLVGHASLMFLWGGKRSIPEIGYWVGESWAGKGIVTAVTLALTKFAFRDLGLQKVRILTEKGNVGSKRVAEKAGYMVGGEEEVDGRKMDTWVIERSDWLG